MSTQERREEIRREVRAYLAGRPALAFRAETIRAKLARENDFVLQEIVDALATLFSGGHVAKVPDPDGATPYYQITREGTLFHERNP